MSERGSFVTEYVYCPKCFEALRAELVRDDKFLKGVVIPGWGDIGHELPIIAGKIGGLSSGEEILDMENDIGWRLDQTLCHRVRIAVLADSGESKIVECGPETDDVPNAPRVG